jgi:hypothetical protein
MREAISKEPSNEIATSDESEALKDYWYTTYRTLFPDSPEPSFPYVPFYENVSLESICQPRYRDVDADNCQTPSLSSGTSYSRSLAPSDLSCQSFISIGSNESCCAESGYQSRGHRPANATRAASTFCLRTDPASLLAHVGAQFSGIEYHKIAQQNNRLKAEDCQSSISADGLHPNLASAILPAYTATRQFVSNTAGDPAGAPNDGYQAEASGSGRKRARDEHIPSIQPFPYDKRDDESESENEQPPSGTQLPDSAEPQANRRVKCPLAALDPEAHSECIERSFRNTDDLTRVSLPIANPHERFLWEGKGWLELRRPRARQDISSASIEITCQRMQKTLCLREMGKTSQDSEAMNIYALRANVGWPFGIFAAICRKDPWRSHLVHVGPQYPMSSNKVADHS